MLCNELNENSLLNAIEDFIDEEYSLDIELTINSKLYDINLDSLELMYLVLVLSEKFNLNILSFQDIDFTKCTIKELCEFLNNYKSQVM